MRPWISVLLLTAIVAMVCYATEANSVPRSKYKDAPKSRLHISHARHHHVVPAPNQPGQRVQPRPQRFQVLVGGRPFGPAPPPPPRGVPARPPGPIQGQGRNDNPDPRQGRNGNPDPRFPNNNAPRPGPPGQDSGRGHPPRRSSV
ncbi:hypothetical protein ANCDUO_08933 [Ancylostoma duodenale]|uniref:Uncharacterized protein n=1 Tax=Ancylostoma duodenale TaxID=51022 RepID=A0A0C2GNZ0_9BILA|nr:hypothetical protein ANCDUO_08933 [Ancylostoma duodenale]